MTTNKTVLTWVDEAVALCKPDHVLWIDGSDKQADMLRQEAFGTGELIPLNQDKLPGCVLHRSDVNDVARVEDRTFICCRRKEDAGPTNNWFDPKEAYPALRKLYDGCMKGRTMYVIPFVMGPVSYTHLQISSISPQPLRAAFSLATRTATSSISTPTVRALPSSLAQMARIPLPVPTSSMLMPGRSERSSSFRQRRVVSWVPVPKAMPGSRRMIFCPSRG